MVDSMVSADSSQRPYLIRAMHEWMTDAGTTPHLVLDASVPGVQVPAEHVHDGKIVLNCGYSATRNLVLGNDEIAFEARFSGTPRRIVAPVAAVLGIITRENGEGILFAEPAAAAADAPPPNTVDGDNDTDPTPPPAGPGKSHLRIVK